MSVFGWSLPAGCGSLPGEQSGAYCVTVDGVVYAWDEDDNVWRDEGENLEDQYDDGFRKVGTLAWPDDDDGESALRRFVGNLKREG